MKYQKDIGDLFRENQHKLDETPSPDAWSRLEGMLDRHEESQSEAKGKKPVSKRRKLFNYLAIAASVAILVGAISLINLQMTRSDKSMAAAKSNKEFATPVYLEDLEIMEDSDAYYQAVDYQKKHKDNYKVVALNEGKPGRQLLATVTTGFRDYAALEREKQKRADLKSRTNRKPSNAKQDIAGSNLEKIAAVAKTKISATKTETSSNIALSNETMDAKDIVASIPTQMEVEADMVKVMNAPAKSYESKSDVFSDDAVSAYVADDKGTEADLVVVEAYTPPNADPNLAANHPEDLDVDGALLPSKQIPTKVEDQVLSAPPAYKDVVTFDQVPSDEVMEGDNIEIASSYSTKAKASRTAKKETASPTAGAMPEHATAPSAPHVSNFHWLLGLWKIDHGNDGFVEKWVYTGWDKITAGSGESHVIYMKDNLVTFRIVLDIYQGSLVYQLKSYDNGVAVFENKAIDYPKEIHIQQTNNNKYTISLQNVDGFEIPDYRVEQLMKAYLKEDGVFTKTMVRQ